MKPLPLAEAFLLGVFEENGHIYHEHEQDDKAVEQVERGNEDVEPGFGVPGNAEQQEG